MNIKTDTGHASSGKYTALAESRQKAVRVYCAERNIYKQDFAKMAKVSLSTLYRFLRGEKLFEPFEDKINLVLGARNAGEI